MKPRGDKEFWNTIYESELKWLRKALDDPTSDDGIRDIIKRQIESIERKIERGTQSFGIG